MRLNDVAVQLSRGGNMANEPQQEVRVRCYPCPEEPALSAAKGPARPLHPSWRTVGSPSGLASSPSRRFSARLI